MLVPLIFACWMLILLLTVAVCHAARRGDRQEELAAAEAAAPGVQTGHVAMAQVAMAHGTAIGERGTGPDGAREAPVPTGDAQTAVLASLTLQSG